MSRRYPPQRACLVWLGAVVLAFILASGAIATGWFMAVSHAGVINTGVPDLPAELMEKPRQRKGGKLPPRYTLVDFYANWCGTCQRLAPEVEKLSEQVKSKVHTIHINIDLPQNEKYATLFNVHGTPTYMLFNPEGKALYKMERILQVPALRARTLSLVGMAPVYKLPDNLSVANNQQYTLVSFRPKSCQNCATLDAAISPLDDNPKAKLSVVHLDPDKPTHAAYQKQVKVTDREGLILLDERYHPLARFSDDTHPEQLHQTLVFFLNGTW